MSKRSTAPVHRRKRATLLKMNTGCINCGTTRSSRWKKCSEKERAKYPNSLSTHFCNHCRANLSLKSKTIEPNFDDSIDLDDHDEMESVSSQKEKHTTHKKFNTRNKEGQNRLKRRIKQYLIDQFDTYDTTVA
jgi:predicted  nucleic acid-binding Zn-ribbon protein